MQEKIDFGRFLFMIHCSKMFRLTPGTGNKGYKNSVSDAFI